MSRGIDQSRPIKALPSNASSNRSRAPLSPPIAISSRSSSHQVATAKPRSNQIDAKKKVGALPPAKKSGTRVVDSDSEEIEEDSIDENASEEIEEDEEEVVRSAHWPIKETPKTSTRKTSKAAPSDGPKAHSAPTITPRNVRINSKPDYMGSDPQPAAAASSSTKTRPASLAASEPSKTTPVPRQSSSASSSQRKEVQHPFVEAEQQQQRVDVEQDQESGTSSRSQSQPSSSKKSAWTSQAPPPTPRASHIVRLPQPPPAAAVGPAPKVVVDRSPTPQPRHPSVVNDQEEEQPEAARLRSASPQNRRVVDRHRGVDRSGQGSAAPPSVPRKPVKELADLVERLEDREEEEGTNLLKHTLDIIVTELNMRYSSRVKKTQLFVLSLALRSPLQELRTDSFAPSFRPLQQS
ncbi:hypothetical protein BDY24DRAFT_287245 [Mrakia frigida]|uniref:uncharacterized protein n=1 Tax=Mrakia frigida TaxID=29902 RepID=UPI003FCC0246